MDTRGCGGWPGWRGTFLPSAPVSRSAGESLGIWGSPMTDLLTDADASMSLDVYSHVMPPDEIAAQRFAALIAP